MPTRWFEIRSLRLGGRRERWGVVLAAAFVVIIGAIAMSSPLPEGAAYPRGVSDGLIAFSDPATGLWGFTGPDEKAVVIDPQFDAVDDFKAGYAWAAFPAMKAWCQIDKHGALVGESTCMPGRPSTVNCEFYCPHVLLSPRVRYRSSLSRFKGFSARELVGGVADRVIDLPYSIRSWWISITPRENVNNSGGATF
jgi:hypothetical protein